MPLKSSCQRSEFSLRLRMTDEIQYVKSRLADHKGRFALSKTVGVKYSFVQKLACHKASGYSKAGYEQIQKLAAYFRQQEAS